MVDTLLKWVSPKVDRKKEIMLAVGAKRIILKTGPAIGQSPVLGYELLFGKVKAKLVGGGLVAETRAVLVDIIVTMGRQVMLKVKGKHIVSCEQQEDSLPRGQGELLEESVASEEELSCKSSSKVDSTDFALDEELDY